MPDLVHGSALTQRHTHIKAGSEARKCWRFCRSWRSACRGETVDLVAPCTSIQSQKRSFHFLTDLTLHTLFVCIVLFCTSVVFLFLSEFYQTGQLSFMTQADSF